MNDSRPSGAAKSNIRNGSGTDKIAISSVVKAAIVVAAASAPFTVVGALRILGSLPITTLFLGIASASVFILVLHRGRIGLSSSGRLVIGLLAIPFLLAFVIGLPAAAMSGPLGIDYEGYLSVAVGRIANFTLLIVFFAGALSLLHDRRPNEAKAFAESIARAYWIGAGLLVAIAVWQTLQLYFGVPYPFPETRTHVHSVPQALRGLVPGRLTSLASEPSFLAPFVIDFVLLSQLFIKGRLLIAVFAVSATVLLLSFSAGGYLNAVIVATALLMVLSIRVCSGERFRARNSVLFAAIGAASLILMFLLTPYLELVTARIGTALDPETHARAYMVLMPFHWLAESTPVNILFGHGPKAYALLGQVASLPGNGNPVHVTSNNMLSDIVWEHGLVGLFALLSLFVILALKTRALVFSARDRLVAFLLLVHLFASSLYRGDFSSLRFFLILLIVITILQGHFDGEGRRRVMRKQ